MNPDDAETSARRPRRGAAPASRIDMGIDEVVPSVADLNCDASINGFDIDAFVLALSDPAAYAAQFPECDILHADGNGDGTVNGFDIERFIAMLSPCE